jgi:hypothetical protein
VWLCGLLLSGALLGLMVVRPLAYAVTPGNLLGFWAFVILYVAAPGMLLVRALGVLDDDAPMAVGCGIVLGLGLETAAYLLFKLTGLPVLFYVYPLIVLIAALRRHRGPSPVSTPSSGLLFLAMLAALAQELHGLVTPARLSEPLPIDLLFHAGNAAELRNHWPLQDPRVAGTPLVYHFFGYCLHAGASHWTGQAVAPILLVMAPGPAVALLALQIYNVGRVLFRSAPAGLVAAGLVLFHVDVGAEVIPALGGFRSYLGAAIYGSTTTLFGFLYFMTLALVVHRYFAEGGGKARHHLLAMGLLSFVASGTKGSVMPVVIAGLVALVGVRAWTTRRLPRRPLAALGVAAAAAAPMTAYLSRGQESFVAMFRFLPGSVPEGSAFLRHACEVVSGGGPNLLVPAPCAQVPALVRVALTGIWAVGYLGIGGMAGLAWLRRHRAALGDAEVWTLGVTAAGAAAAYFLATASGLSQLFFLYNGQVMLAVLGGGFLVEAAREPRRRLAALVLCGLGTLPVVMKAVWGVTTGLEGDVRQALLRPSPLERQYGQGLAFLREETPRDAVVVGRYGSLLVSAFAERRSFYETGYFTSHAHRLRQEGIGEAFPDRLAAQRAMWERPDRRLVTSVLGPLPGTPVLLFVDDVILDPSAGWMSARLRPMRRPSYPQGTAAPLFANGAVAVYRVDGDGTAGRESGTASRTQPARLTFEDAVATMLRTRGP